jgi:hypothetical protein
MLATARNTKRASLKNHQGDHMIGRDAALSCGEVYKKLELRGQKNERSPGPTRPHQPLTLQMRK